MTNDIANNWPAWRKEHQLRSDYVPPGGKATSTALGELRLYDHRIALYREKGGSITYRYLAPKAHSSDAERGRTGEHEVINAIVFADNYLASKAAQYLRGGIIAAEPVGLSASTTTLADTFAYIRANAERLFPTSKPRREVLRTLLLLEQIWDTNRLLRSLAPSDVNRYISRRTEEVLLLPREFSARPRLDPCKPVTAVNDLLMVATALKKISGEVDKETNERPFSTDLNAWLQLPEVEKALRTKPTAQRFDTLLEYVDRVDPSGQLRLTLVLVRWLGRRIGAVAALKRSDLRLTAQEMEETIQLIEHRGHQARDGMQTAAFAYEFKEGGIFFDRDRDKKKYQRLVPISRTIRQEVERYLARYPDLKPNGPLFPSMGDPRQHTTVVEFIARLHAAETAAREDGFGKEVPLIYGSVFHGYRGLRASEMENQGHRGMHVNFIVGWSCKVGTTKEVRYVMHDPRLLYAAVEDLRPVEIEKEYQAATARADRENATLRDENTRLSTQIAEMQRVNELLIKQLSLMQGQMERLEGLFSRGLSQPGFSQSVHSTGG